MWVILRRAVRRWRNLPKRPLRRKLIMLLSKKRFRNPYGQDKGVSLCRIIRNCIRQICRTGQNWCISISMTGWTKKRRLGRVSTPLRKTCRYPAARSNELSEIWKKQSWYEKSRTTVKTAVRPPIGIIYFKKSISTPMEYYAFLVDWGAVQNGPPWSNHFKRDYSRKNKTQLQVFITENWI